MKNRKNLYLWCKENNKDILLREWDYKKNGKISPKDVGPFDRTKYYWICSKCGNGWMAQIHNRVYGNGCPLCAHKNKNRKFNDEQIEKLKIYYPIGDWDSLLKTFPNSKKVNIKALARRYNLIQNRKDLISNRDISGQKFNKLTAICIDHKKDRFIYWKCKCECGNETIVDMYSLIKGTVKSCGCLRHKQAINTKDYTGQRFGKLTAIERLPRYRGYRTFYKCKCDCGNETIVDTGNLHSLHIVSCGKCKPSRIDYWNYKHPYDDDKRTYIVYKHTSPKGKSYIGITKQDAERRFQNGYGYITQKTFYRAINKYGWNSFTHEVLEENLTEKEASERERYYIKKLNTFAPNGYNTAEGGTTGFGKKCKPIIQYYRGKEVNFFESITEAMKCLGIASFTISSHIGEEKEIGGYSFEVLEPIYPYNIPQEWREIVDKKHYHIKKIIAEEVSKNTISRNIKGTKLINKYSLDGKYICTYNNHSDIKRDLHREKIEGIRAAANPNRKGNVAYGYMWKFDTGNHHDIAPIEYKNHKSILQIDVKTNRIIEEFSSISEAERKTKYSKHYIRKVCSGELKDYKGFKWSYK